MVFSVRFTNLRNAFVVFKKVAARAGADCELNAEGCGLP